VVGFTTLAPSIDAVIPPPPPVIRGAFAHSRNTIRSVATSGVKVTDSVPSTTPSSGFTSIDSEYCGRSVRGAGRSGTAGQLAVAGAARPGVTWAGPVTGGFTRGIVDAGAA